MLEDSLVDEAGSVGMVTCSSGLRLLDDYNR